MITSTAFCSKQICRLIFINYAKSPIKDLKKITAINKGCNDVTKARANEKEISK